MTTSATERRRLASSISRAPSVGVEGDQDEVDEFDEYEGDDDAADSVDPAIAPENRCGRGGAEFHTTQGERDECHDHERIEYDGGEDGTLGAVELHDVQRVQLRIRG